jgi:hypothetical protein
VHFFLKKEGNICLPKAYHGNGWHFFASCCLTLAVPPTPADTVEQRVDSIVRSITETIFAFVARGLFGRHCPALDFFE